MTPDAKLLEARAALDVLRRKAEAAFVPWHPWGDKEIPQRASQAEWREDVRGYLGGDWGEHAAAHDPAATLRRLDAVALTLDAAEATMGRHHDVGDTRPLCACWRPYPCADHDAAAGVVDGWHAALCGEGLPDKGYVCEDCGCWNPSGQACKYESEHEEEQR